MKKMVVLISILLAGNVGNALMSVPLRSSTSLNVTRNTSFTENWMRYPSPPVIFERLKAWFPKSKLVCGVANQNIIGDSNPASGTPVYEEPGAAYIEWFSKCVATSAQIEFETLSSSGSVEDLKIVYGEVLIKACAGANGSIDPLCRLGGLSDGQIEAIVEDQLFILAGDEDVLEARGFGPRGTTIREELKKLIAELKNTKDLNLVVEALTYDGTVRSAVAFIKYFVLVQMDQRF